MVCFLVDCMYVLCYVSRQGVDIKVSAEEILGSWDLKRKMPAKRSWENVLMEWRAYAVAVGLSGALGTEREEENLMSWVGMRRCRCSTTTSGCAWFVCLCVHVCTCDGSMFGYAYASAPVLLQATQVSIGCLPTLVYNPFFETGSLPEPVIH